VTMTMPDSLFLTDSSKITFPVTQKDTADHSVINLVIAADHKSATFVPAPTVDTTATVTYVVNGYITALKPVTVNTETKVTGTQSGTVNGYLPAVITPASDTGNPVAAGVITVTLNPAYAYQTVGTISTFDFAKQTPPIFDSVTGFSADSTVAQLFVGPNVQQTLFVTSITFKGAPEFVYDLFSKDSVFTPKIDSLPGTMSDNAPQVAQNITITAGAGYTFTPTATISYPLNPNTLIQSQTATTITFQPTPGSAGIPTVQGVIASSSPMFTLTLPAAVGKLAMQATSALTGTDAFATAPLIVPNGTYDLGTFGGEADCGLPCQVYKINVAAAGPVTFTLSYPTVDDLGLYFLDSGLNYIFGAECDALGPTTTPETCTQNFPAAGTYYLEVDDYGSFYAANYPPPPWIKLVFN
jgi:hypothetical protein